MLDKDAGLNWKNEGLGLKAAGSGYPYVTDGGIPHFIPYIRSLRLSIFYTTSMGSGNGKSRPKSWVADCHTVAVHLEPHAPAVRRLHT